MRLIARYAANKSVAAEIQYQVEVPTARQPNNTSRAGHLGPFQGAILNSMENARSAGESKDIQSEWVARISLALRDLKAAVAMAAAKTLNVKRWFIMQQ